MINMAVARRYAKALLEIGEEQKNLDALVDEILRASEAYEASLELRNAVENPLVPRDAKVAILSELADRLGIGATARHTVLLLNDRRRMRVLPGVAQLLKEMTDVRRGVLRAVVTTAVPLGDAYYDRLRGQLEKMTGKRVVLDRREDPTLIGGVVARIGDTVIDGSLRARLQEMKSALLSA